MAREQELGEVARAKGQLRAAAKGPVGWSVLFKAAAGAVGLLSPRRRPESRQDKALVGKGASASRRPLVILAGAAAAAVAAGLLLRRSAGGR